MLKKKETSCQMLDSDVRDSARGLSVETYAECDLEAVCLFRSHIKSL